MLDNNGSAQALNVHKVLNLSNFDSKIEATAL